MSYDDSYDKSYDKSYDDSYDWGVMIAGRQIMKRYISTYDLSCDLSYDYDCKCKINYQYNNTTRLLLLAKF